MGAAVSHIAKLVLHGHYLHRRNPTAVRHRCDSDVYISVTAMVTDTAVTALTADSAVLAVAADTAVTAMFTLV